MSFYYPSFFPQKFSGQKECFFDNPNDEKLFKRRIVFAQNPRTFKETRLIKLKSFHRKIRWTRREEILQLCRFSYQNSNFLWSKSKKKFKDDNPSQKNHVFFRKAALHTYNAFYTTMLKLFSKVLLFGPTTRINKIK